MMWDFGVDPSQFDNESVIFDKVQEIDDTFDLVLITERFPESIVLLKDLLCWNYTDLGSLKLNVHEKSTKSTLSTEARKALEQWLWADYQLYNHFKVKFDLKVKSFRTDVMKSELEIMKEINDNVELKCNATQVPNKDLEPGFRLLGHGVMGYKVNENIEQCRYYGMRNIALLTEVRKHQKNRARKKLRKTRNRH